MIRWFAGFAALLALSACGYTSKTLLPEHIQTVHVAKVPNQIDITGDVTNKTAFKVYRPGLEVELRNAVIDRIVFDGHLKIGEEEKSDAVLQMELIDFRRDPLRYKTDDSIQEFRINVTASARLIDKKTGTAVWQSSAISGNDTYLLSGRLAKTEDQAVAAALDDLARHLVENVLEIW